METIFSSIGNKELLSKKVASKIEEAIRNKKIAQGDKLPTELELCAQFNVSRTAIREALRMLSAKGLISIQKGKGIFVMPPSSDHVISSMKYYLFANGHVDDPLTVLEARLIIEPTIAEYAAIYHDDNDIIALQENYEDMKKNTDRDRHAHLDLEFHHLIAESTKNPIMPLILNPIHSLMPKIKSKIMVAVPNAKEAALVWHLKILEAIKSSDPALAREMMKQHLLVAKEHTEQMLTEQAQ